MSKYAALGAFLRGQGKDRLAMSFRDVEHTIAAKLPPSARQHRAWWSNNRDNNVATREWLDAGYATEDVDLEGQRLVFRRKSGTGVAEGALATWGGGKHATAERALTPAHHPLFGLHKGLIRIAPGTDLTQPAEPDWGKD